MKQKLPPLHNICGKDKSRPDFMQIWFTKKRVYVSDCYILMWAERKDFFEKYCYEKQNAPDEFSISAEVWKKLSKFSHLVFLPENMVTTIVDGVYKFNDPDEFKMPPFDEVIPESFEGQVERISINPKLLAKISAVFKSDCGKGDCVLDFISEKKAMSVLPVDDSYCMFKSILFPVYVYVNI